MTPSNVDTLNFAYLLKHTAHNNDSLTKHTAKLHDEVDARLTQLLAVPGQFLQLYCTFDVSVFNLVDGLYGDLNELKVAFNELSADSFLTEELFNLVNNPMFRGDGETWVDITDSKHAGIFLGREAMRLATPYSAIKEYCRNATSSTSGQDYGKLTLKLWQEFIKVALKATTLCELKSAQYHEQAFIFAAMIYIAKSVTIQAYLSLFESLRASFEQQARRKLNIELLKNMEFAKPNLMRAAKSMTKIFYSVVDLLAQQLSFNYMTIDRALCTLGTSDTPSFVGAIENELCIKSYYFSVVTDLNCNDLISSSQKEAFCENFGIQLSDFAKLRQLGITLKRLISKEREQTKIIQMLNEIVLKHKLQL